MGYSTTSTSLIKNYTPSDDVVVNDATESLTSSTTYIKVKELELIRRIDTQSLFRFKFDMKSSGAGRNAFGKVYRNGAAVGTEFIVVGAAYTTCEEDLTETDWVVGDLVQLYCKDQNGAGFCYTKNFQICGAGGEWRVV